jgi:hypothetical protein
MWPARRGVTKALKFDPAPARLGIAKSEPCSSVLHSVTLASYAALAQHFLTSLVRMHPYSRRDIDQPIRAHARGVVMGTNLVLDASASSARGTKKSRDVSPYDHVSFTILGGTEVNARRVNCAAFFGEC